MFASAGPILLRSAPLFSIEVTEVSAPQVSVDEPFQITITIDNQAPCDLSCDSIWLALGDAVADSRIENLKPKVERQISSSSLDNRHVMNLPHVKKQLPQTINLRSHFEGTPNDPVSTGIACINSHELLSRKDSYSGMTNPMEDKIIKDVHSQRTSISDIVLKPGSNTFILKFEVCAGILQCHRIETCDKSSITTIMLQNATISLGPESFTQKKTIHTY